MVQQQLEQLSVIGRCEYQKTCTLLVQLFDQAARSYQEALSVSSSPSIEMSIQEGKLLIKLEICQPMQIFFSLFLFQKSILLFSKFF